ncbi:DUF2798 domain-containing protein, partial [Pseudomonas sp. EA_65y_Pfl1_P113]|uniref:DUF2798 domain-containing protein n=1 Tax=Pseudomonas sp. EA_65y_Pfl1_P113 TaxID=3088692 RepID=UPI0030D75EE3
MIAVRKLPARYAPIVMPFVLSLLMTAVVSVISTLRSLGATPAFLATWPGAWALSWVVAFPTLLLVLLGMALRGVGDSITPLWFTVLSVVLDSGLNPVFIRGWFGMPAMGIAGSATATLISAHVAAFGLLAFIYLRDLPIRLRGHELTWLIPSPALIRTIIGKGLPMGAQML